MKSKDQQLLEEAYEEVLLDEKLNWKGALTGLALAAAQLIGGASQAKAADYDRPVAGVEQSQNVTAEDLIPRKEFDEVLDMMRSAVAKGDLKSAKQILNVIEKECNDGAAKVNSSKEIHKLADMHMEAMKIFHDAYNGIVKAGVGAMAGHARASSNQ